MWIIDLILKQPLTAEEELRLQNGVRRYRRQINEILQAIDLKNGSC